MHDNNNAGDSSDLDDGKSNNDNNNMRDADVDWPCGAMAWFSLFFISCRLCY